MPIVYFVGMLAMLGFGVNVLWINWRRLVNRVFAGICFLCTLYFGFTIMARYYGHLYAHGEPYRGLVWVRLTWTTTAFMPLYLWALFYIVSGHYRSGRELLFKLLPWGLITASLCILVWTQLFITNANLPDHRTQGPGFWIFQVVLNVAAVWLFVRSVLLAPKLKGIRKLEFQYLTINCAALSIFAVLLPLLTFLPMPLRKLVTIPIVCYGISGWSIASRRVYNSVHIYSTLIVRSLVLMAVGFGALWVIDITNPWESNVYARVAIIALFCVGGWIGDDRFSRWFWLKPEQQIQNLRKQLTRIGDTEQSPEALLAASEQLLLQWTGAKTAVILRLDGAKFVGHDVDVPERVLRESSNFSEGWVTSASMARVRGNDADAELRAIISREHIGALVAGNWKESGTTTIFALGDRENDLPFTYPEVRRLQELVEVIEAGYTKAVLRLQARQAEQLRAAHTDRLATVGLLASLTNHEARNRLEAIKSALELLAGGMEANITQEHRELLLKEVEAFASEFNLHLDMARVDQSAVERVSSRAIVEESVLVLRPLLNQKRITVRQHHEGREVTIAANRRLLRQVFVNLLKNAVDSLNGAPNPRIVIQTVAHDDSLEIIVADSGPGVAEEMREKLFREFVTSKSGGTGLGLSISRRIIHDLNGRIEFVSAQLLPGAHVRIVLPIMTGALQLTNANSSVRA